jgi:hypothetical protein
MTLFSVLPRPTIAALALAGALAVFPACSSKPPRKVERVAVQPRAVPEPLRGTIGSLAQSTAGEPMLISGFGLVVGLNGTGGGLLDERVAATMERQMALQGVGRAANVEGTMLEDPVLRRPKTPPELLRDKNVAVALVQAVIPRGAPEGFSFDVYIQAMNATSLEGGRLWTTELRLGPPSVFGAVQTQSIGTASGELFINPFEDPAETLSVQARTVGRVLAGGVVTEPMGIRLTLDVPSHQRARTVSHAINSRFPTGPRDREPAARGRDDAIIELTVPASHRDRPNEFLRIVEHLPVDMVYAGALAQRYVDDLRAMGGLPANPTQPTLAEDLIWCLVAVGDQALPHIRGLYEDPEPRLRIAGLRAGALLGDGRAAPALLDVATSGDSAARAEAITLLGELEGGPQVDKALRELLDSGTLTTRVAAYEALATRAERAEYSRLLAIEAQRPASSGMARTPQELAIISRLVIPPQTLQGVQRVTIPGKFVLDVVPFGSPLVYVTQQGTPRVVLFGRRLEVERPLLASAWDDRLVLVADSASEDPRLRYEDYRSGRVRVETVGPSLPDLVVFMAKDPRPEDDQQGLGMSYSETVGALYALYDAGAIEAAFATETDRLMAELVEAARSGRVLERPETLADKEQPEVEGEVVVDVSYLKAERARKPEVVPLPPKEPKKK